MSDAIKAFAFELESTIRLLEQRLNELEKENKALHAEIETRLASLPGEMMTEKEVRARLKLSEDTVRMLRKQKRIAHAYFGTCVRYRRADVEAFAESQTIQARPRKLRA
jgi:excisionase family DNA binding protein